MTVGKAVRAEREWGRLWSLDWDCILCFTLSNPTSFKAVDQNLDLLAYEIEREHGTPTFLSLRLIPRKYDGAETMAVLAVGGATVEDWSVWTARWNEIDGQSDSRCVARYRVDRPYTARPKQIFDELIGAWKIGPDVFVRLDIGPAFSKPHRPKPKMQGKHSSSRNPQGELEFPGEKGQ